MKPVKKKEKKETEKLGFELNLFSERPYSKSYFLQNISEF